MKTWVGKVVQLSDTQWRDDIYLYSFKIEQSERWFRLGRNKPTFKEGEWIRFNERNTQVDVQSVEVGVKETQPSDSAKVSTTREGSSPTPTAQNVGQRLQYQAARADATRIVCAALQCDHLPHAANTAKGKRLDLLMGYVKEVTHELLAQENEGL